MTKIPKLGGNCVDANQIFFDDFEIDESNLVGKEGEGFKAILHGMNAERCLLAGEALGTGYLAKKMVSFMLETFIMIYDAEKKRKRDYSPCLSFDFSFGNRLVKLLTPKRISRPFFAHDLFLD